MRQKDYKSLHVRLEPKYKKMREKLANQENRTLTAIIERLIERKYLELSEKRSLLG